MDIGEIICGLRKRFSEALPGVLAHREMMPSGREELLLRERPPAHRAGAVVLLLYPVDGQLYIAFIKRQTYNGPHSGQVAFPGGKIERSDASLLHTAMRETYEEIGVQLTETNILGALTELYIPVSHTIVYPFVGYVSSRPVFAIDSGEVAYVFDVSLQTLLLPETRTVWIDASDLIPRNTPYFAVSNEIIWGATAMVLNELLVLVKDLQTS